MVSKRPIRITFIPNTSPITTRASSRLRAKYLAEHLRSRYPNQYFINYNDPENANIIIINKEITKELFERVKRAKKKKNSFVIYDVVDRIYDQNKKLFDQIAELSNLVTVANKKQLTEIKRFVRSIPCCIVPDGIDYFEQMDPSNVLFNKKVVWFGNHYKGNLASSMWAINYIQNRTPLSISIIGNKNELKIQNGVKVIEWKYKGFIKCLKEHSICFLSHDPSQQQKSNNRLIVSIANGIPAIVSGSSEYAELLRKYKLDYAIVSNEAELQNALHILSNENNRIQYLKEIQPKVIEQYNYSAVVKVLNQIINKYYVNKT